MAYLKMYYVLCVSSLTTTHNSLLNAYIVIQVQHTVELLEIVAEINRLKCNDKAKLKHKPSSFIKHNVIKRQTMTNYDWPFTSSHSNR